MERCMVNNMEKINTEKLLNTGEKKNFVIGGVTEQLDIYRIPIRNLKFNDKNGRIASYISEYIDDNGEFPENQEDVNDIIAEFVINSNRKSFIKTKNNIAQLGQLEPAVILDNGVVVDGNRRFSVLRELHKERGEEFGYLKAAVIPSLYDNRQIKILELNLQHAKDNPVDYNPIERLVDIYRDVIKNKDTVEGFTDEQYARETDKSLKETKKDVEISRLMIEYLEFIKQPEKFHIARNLKLDGPLREINKILKMKKIDSTKIIDVKYVLFAYLTTVEGDATREIRKLKKVFENDQLSELYISQSEDILDDFEDFFDDEDNQAKISKKNVVEVPSDISSQLNSVTDQIIDDSNLKDAKRKPINLIKQSAEKADKIELEEVSLIKNELLDEFKVYLESLEHNIINIKKALEDAE